MPYWLQQALNKAKTALGAGDVEPPQAPMPGRLRNIDYSSLAKRTRPLNDEEKQYLQALFGNTNVGFQMRLGYNPQMEGTNVRGYVDPQVSRVSAYIPPDVENTAYPTLAHEATHVYQNLRGEGRLSRVYDYGGADGLSAALVNGVPWEKFTSEQQASIIADSLKPENANHPAYKYYLNYVRSHPAPVVADPSEAFADSLRSRYADKDQWVDDIKKRLESTQ